MHFDNSMRSVFRLKLVMSNVSEGMQQFVITQWVEIGLETQHFELKDKSNYP